MKKKDDKFLSNIFPLNRYVLKDSMKSIVVDYKKNKYEKDIVEEYSSFKARELLNKIDDILPKPINFFENLNYFTERLTDHEKVLFILAKLELNSITGYPRLINEHLHTLKSNNKANGSSNDLSYINRLLKELEEVNRIIRIHECPNCGRYYASQSKRRFPEYCGCGHHFFLQQTSFKKKSNHPYCLVELTGDGWESLNRLTMSSLRGLLRASHFCISWLEFLRHKKT